MRLSAVRILLVLWFIVCLGMFLPTWLGSEKIRVLRKDVEVTIASEEDSFYVPGTDTLYAEYRVKVGGRSGKELVYVYIGNWVPISKVLLFTLGNLVITLVAIFLVEGKRNAADSYNA